MLSVRKSHGKFLELTLQTHFKATEEREFFKLFPEISKEQVLLLYVESSQGKIVCPQKSCKRRCSGEDARVRKMFAYVAAKVANEFPDVAYLSYYNVSGTSLDPIKCQFASNDGTAMFGMFTYNPEVMNKIEIHKLIVTADDALNEFKKAVDADLTDLKTGFTGVDVLAKASSDASEKQLVTVDSFTMPVAFFIFYYMVRSWRLLMLCIWNMLVTVTSSFGFLSLLVKMLHLRPMSVQATFAQALAVSMSIDYSLFLHRRFRDEMKNGRTVQSASRVMLQQAGHVVALSCGTFILVFVGFLFLPSHDLIALGEVAIVTLFFALCVNTTNTVAAIATFPSFFASFTFASKTVSSSVDAEASSSVSTVNVPLLPPTSTGKKRFRRGAPYRGWYYRFLKTVTVFPNNLLFILFVYALAIPLAFQATRLQHNQNAIQVTPKSASSAKIYEDLQDHFSAGLLGAFSLIVVSDSVNARSREFFESTHSAITTISKETGVDMASFLSPTSLNGKAISYAESVQLRNPSSSFCRAIDQDLCKLYQYVWNEAINKDESALITPIHVPFNPYSRQGMSFVEDVRKAADEFMAENEKYHILFTGTEVDFYEDMHVAFSSVTVLIITTLFVVFLLLGMGFRSAFIPIRLSLTVFIPLAAVFGFAVLVYQDGILDGLGITALKKTDDGFFWFIPLVCLFQALGLVLDYGKLYLFRYCKF